MLGTLQQSFSNVVIAEYKVFLKQGRINLYLKVLVAMRGKPVKKKP